MPLGNQRVPECVPSVMSLGLAAAIIFSPRKAAGEDVMTLGKSSQVYSAFGLRLLGKKIIGV